MPKTSNGGICFGHQGYCRVISGGCVPKFDGRWGVAFTTTKVADR